MKKTPRRPLLRTPQSIGQFCGLDNFREDFQIKWYAQLSETGCLDAPMQLPAGSTYRFIHVDKMAEKITAWPALKRTNREFAP